LLQYPGAVPQALIDVAPLALIRVHSRSSFLGSFDDSGDSETNAHAEPPLQSYGEPGATAPRREFGNEAKKKKTPNVQRRTPNLE
jgi:hypothetical protein